MQLPEFKTTLLNYLYSKFPPLNNQWTDYEYKGWWKMFEELQSTASPYILPNDVTLAANALAKHVTFDDTMLHCELQDGRIISVPLSWYPRLHRANAEQRDNWELIGRGSGIHWPLIDEDLPVRAFLSGGYNAKDKQPH